MFFWSERKIKCLSNLGGVLMCLAVDRNCLSFSGLEKPDSDSPRLHGLPSFLVCLFLQLIVSLLSQRAFNKHFSVLLCHYLSIYSRKTSSFDATIINICCEDGFMRWCSVFPLHSSRDQTA